MTRSLHAARCWYRALSLLGACLLAGGLATAEPAPAAAPVAPAAPAAPAAWGTIAPPLKTDLESGAPLLVHVFVPLCSNYQIWCGAKFAGQPGHAKTNIYWGAIYGARRFMERKDSVWTQVHVGPGQAPVLERAVYRREVPAAKWGLSREIPVEQIVVLEAVHGSYINQAVERLWDLASVGGTVTFPDGGTNRTERVHVVGYVGHNRLMDGIPFPPKSAAAPTSGQPIPSFVLACNSEYYFTRALRAAGSRPLVMTRTYMAPEGYVVDAMLRGLGDNLPEPELRQRVVAAYAKWQRISHAEAEVIFAKR